MSVHETPPSGVQGRDAVIIPFPNARTAPQYEVETTDEIQLPDAETLIKLIRTNFSADVSGADVMLLIYEETGLIPKKADIDTVTIAIERLRQYRLDYDTITGAMLDKKEQTRQLSNLRQRIKKHGFRPEDMSDNVLTELSDTLESMMLKRAPIQHRFEHMQTLLDKYYYSEPGVKRKDFLQRNIRLFEATDSQVAGDPFLELAEDTRLESQTHGTLVINGSLAFERFARYMMYAEMQEYKLPDSDSTVDEQD